MKEEYIEQSPKEGFDWLTKLDGDSEETRLFAKEISYKAGRGSSWNDCTQEFYDNWQKKYNKPIEAEQ